MEPFDPARFVLFVHGVGGSPISWERQVARLPPGVGARAPWLRGLRPGGREAFDVRDAAADLLTSLDLEGIDRAALVAHALGGLVALQVAVEAPERVSHLVLLAGQGAPTPAQLRAQRWAVALMPRRRLADRGVSKDKLREALRAGGALDGLARPADVAVPTLVVYGSRDRATAPGAELLAREVPGARLEVVDGAGHELMIEAPAEVNRLVYRFLGHPAESG